MRLVITLALVAVMLAGCTSITIPPHAIIDSDDAVPDGTIWGWVEPQQNFTRIVAYFEHNGSGYVTVNWVQPHEYWNLTILDESGNAIIYDERPSRKEFDRILLAPFDETFYFTWLHNEYERYSRAGVDEDLESMQVAPGEYTAVVQFLLADQPDDAFEVRLPITVA